MIRKRLLAAGALLAATACGGEPSAPPDDRQQAVAQRIAVGDTVVGSFSSSDSIGFYTIQPGESPELALFLQAEQGNFGLTISS